MREVGYLGIFVVVIALFVGLSDNNATSFRPDWYDDATLVAQRDGGNFYGLTGINLTSTDNAANSRVDFGLSVVADDLAFTTSSFYTMDASSGSDPVADTLADTLVFTGGSCTTITGDSAADSLTWAVGCLDSETINLGTGNDSQIYYDGTDTFWDLRAVGSGDLMIALAGGFPSPEPESVHIWGGSAGGITAVARSLLIVEDQDSSNQGISILGPNSSRKFLAFGEVTGNLRGRLSYFGSSDSPADTFAIDIALVERLRYSANTFAFQEATTVSTAGNMTLSASAGNDVLIGDDATIVYVDGGTNSGTGSVGVGNTALENTGLAVRGNFTPPVDASAYGTRLLTDFTEAASGTHTTIAQLRVDGRGIFSGGAATTNAAALYIFSAMAGATNNYAAWSDSGNNRFDGDVFVSNGAGVVIGSETQITADNIISELQVSGTGAADSGINQAIFVNSAISPEHIFTKSRAGSVGSNLIVANGDSVGVVRATIDDGTDYNSIVGDILFQVDGAPGANDAPGRLVFRTTPDGSAAPTERLRLDDQGNLGLGSAVNPGAGTATFTMTDGTAPSSLAANTAGIYANDVAGTTELFAIDEAGNSTQLSPHPADFLAAVALACAYPFAESHSNPYLGKKVQVDWCGLIMAVEALTGQKFMTVTDLPTEESKDWYAREAERKARHDAQIAQANKEITEHNARDARMRMRRGTINTTVAANKDAIRQSMAEWALHNIDITALGTATTTEPQRDALRGQIEALREGISSLEAQNLDLGIEYGNLTAEIVYTLEAITQVIVPPPYVCEHPPQWMQDRGVLAQPCP